MLDLDIVFHRFIHVTVSFPLFILSFDPGLIGNFLLIYHIFSCIE